MMTAMEAMRRAGSAARAAGMSKRYAKLGCKAIDDQKFGKAYIFLQKASAFASALGFIQAEYNREARRLGKPTSPLAKCSNCKKQKPDVKRRVDPYREDVDNKKVYCNLCDDCEKSAKEAI